jgi:hypothetical protein
MWLSLISKRLLFFLALIFSVFISTTSTFAAAPHPFYWERMDVDLQLVESGDLLVTETQQYIFTERYNNQRSRYIKMDEIDEIRDVSVTENDQPVAGLQVSKVDGKQYIRWEHAIGNKFPENHVFVLKYRVVGGLEVNDSHTKFKWMAIFPDRHAPVESAQVTLHLPDKLTKFAKEFTTAGIKVESKSIDVNTITFTAKEVVEPSTQLAILSRFDTNSLKLKKSQWQPDLWHSICSIGLNCLKFLLFFGFWSLLANSSNISIGGSCGGGGDGGGCGGCGGCGGGD